VLDKLQITPFFDLILSREDVAHPKPNPSIYFSCLEKLKIDKEDVLIFEDSKPGILAATQTTPNVVRIKNPEELNLSFIEAKIIEQNSHRWVKGPVTEVVIPMAGLGSRFQEAGYSDPKPFISVHGKPMIQWVVENLSSQIYRTRFTFIVNRIQLESYRIEEKLTKIVPDCNIISIPGKTEGAACTVLLALDEISLDRPLLIANSDQYIDISIDDFLKKAFQTNRDGLIMTFPANEKKWSYAKINAEGLVTEVAEKNPISPHATVGIYYFKNARSYVEASQSMIKLDQRTNGEFYVCPVYNELIRNGAQIEIFPILKDAMHGLGTPEDLDCFLRNYHFSEERLAG
jgi:dTDP-glucose pyrophosphorylase